MISELTTITLFGSFYLFLVLSFISLSLFFVAEKEEEGRLSFLLLIIFIGSMYWKGSGYESSIIYSYFTWGNIFIYLSLGLIYSLTRIYLLSRTYKLSKGENLQNAFNSIKDAAIGNFTRWILQFPISFISFAFTDIFSALKKKVTIMFSSIIDSLLKLGIKHNETMVEVKSQSNEIARLDK